jgi:putative membrane protein
MMHNSMVDGSMGFWMVFYMIFWLLIIIGVVFLVFWAVNKGKGSGSNSENETALDILKKRYARGEINKEEFEDKKNELL